MSYTMKRRQLEGIERVLEKDLVRMGVHCVLLIDLAGNVIANYSSGEDNRDIYSLAALAAGNFGAVNAMANILGEDEFSLLFHKGEKENIHFSKVMENYLLITVFGKEVSLGFVRLKVNEAAGKIGKIMNVLAEPL